MALDKPSTAYANMVPIRGALRYAGTLNGLDLDYHVVFRGEHAELVLGELRQLSYQGPFVTLCYIPLFDDFSDGSDYREMVLSVDDLIWVFRPQDIEEVIALRNDLKTRLTRTVSV